MAIDLPAGSEHSERKLTFLESMQPGALDPPDAKREDAGRRIDAAVKVLETAVAAYRRSVEVETGSANAEDRVRLNVKASIRRYAPELAHPLGLTKG